MVRRSLRGAGLGAALALFASGCGGGAAALPTACLTVPQTVESALLAAPGRVALSGGTRLSDCVARATGDGDLESVGSAFSGAADDLAVASLHDLRAALRLGYLVGATRRGAQHSQGIAAELVRRVEQSAGSVATAPAVAAALHRGVLAGEARG
jgi:hypothetical protein